MIIAFEHYFSKNIKDMDPYKLIQDSYLMEYSCIMNNRNNTYFINGKNDF